MNYSQQYHPYEQYHFNNSQFQYSQDPLQSLTPPSEEIYKSSPWSSNNLMANDMECEESNQPERGIAGFVSKLYQCLQSPDDGQKYARWCKHNGIDMFIIDCIPKFTEIVLPKLFKHCKFASFVRQLNIYGFQRDTDARKSKDSRDKETCRWHHIYFRPGRRDLFHLIRRKTPRYSRRKRVRNEGEEEEEVDPETILLTGSGDESDIIINNKELYEIDEEGGSMNSFNNNNNRRNSISSVSTTPSTLQHLPRQNSFDQHYDKPALYPYSDANVNYPFPYQTDAPATSAPLVEICPTQPESCLEEAPVPLHEPSQADYELSKDRYSPSGEQLRSELTGLQKNYSSMYKTLTGEVNKACHVIQAQRHKIEFLENALRQQEELRLKINHPSFVDPPNYMAHQEFLQTAPHTPVYPQTLNQYQEAFFQSEGSPFYQDQLMLSSPCTSNHLTEKWLSPFHQVEELSNHTLVD